MKKVLFFSALLLACHGILFTQSPQTSGWVSQPFRVADDDWIFEGTQNLLLVPENRNDPESRMIALHYIHLPALQPSHLPPVVFLGAGPGETYSAEVFYQGKRAEAWRMELSLVNQERDVILINQRGTSGAPGLPIPDFRYRWNNGGALEQPFDLSLMNENRKKAYAQAIRYYSDKGVDLRGYDALHFIDDIETVRRHLKTTKIALVGTSFGSQWAMGYMRRYPKHVDRALLSGVEPLNNNYDDPEGIWKVLTKIAQTAEAAPNLSAQLPKGGLMEAFKTVLARLEDQPVTVVLPAGEDAKQRTIVVGVDDLRYNLLNPMLRSYRGEIETWPKYIMEMYAGDYRLLAEMSYGRLYRSSAPMNDPLFNNSLGISKERDKALAQRPSSQWLGEVNDHYVATRDICPAPKVNEEFLLPYRHHIPTIFIQGDMDLSTPHGNVEALMPYLERGHLITVKGGSHNAKRALIFHDRQLMEQVYQFMSLDLERFENFKATLPNEVELPPFEFWSIDSISLYDKFYSRR
ncbi:MAG: alpha/beta hydrolase [Saprospiraceae bacterium]|nr:alpha/beta hydrolase [Saprospiraceae bacterium]